jgi:mevalonate kinase
MKTLQIHVPAKTFLAGEYLALKGLGALVFCSKPIYKFQVSKKSQNVCPFHPQSPAGKFWNSQQKFFQEWHIELTSKALKGFGSSTAEFIVVHMLWQLQNSIWIEQERFIDIHQMLKDYQEVAKTEKQTPSGADLVAQVCGGLTYFHKESGKIQTFSWPFQELSLLLLKTQVEVKTHEHLEQLQDFESAELEKIFQDLHLALKKVDEDRFVKAFTAYGEELKRLGFWSPASQEFLKNLNLDGVKAQKGCGAMGADVVAVIMAKKALQETLSVNLIATEKDIAPGAKIILDQEKLLEY